MEAVLRATVEELGTVGYTALRVEDGGWLVTTEGDWATTTIHVWDLHGSQPVSRTIATSEAAGVVYPVTGAISPDGRWYAQLSASATTYVDVWDLQAPGAPPARTAWANSMWS